MTPQLFATSAFEATSAIWFELTLLAATMALGYMLLGCGAKALVPEGPVLANKKMKHSKRSKRSAQMTARTQRLDTLLGRVPVVKQLSDEECDSGDESTVAWSSDCDSCDTPPSSDTVSDEEFMSQAGDLDDMQQREVDTHHWQSVSEKLAGVFGDNACDTDEDLLSERSDSDSVDLYEMGGMLFEEWQAVSQKLVAIFDCDSDDETLNDDDLMSDAGSVESQDLDDMAEVPRLRAVSLKLAGIISEEDRDAEMGNIINETKEDVQTEQWRSVGQNLSSIFASDLGLESEDEGF